MTLYNQARLPYMNEQLQRALQAFRSQAEKDAKRQVFGIEFPRPQSQRQQQQGVLQQGVLQQASNFTLPEKKLELIVDLQTNLLIDHGLLKRVLIVLGLLRKKLSGAQSGGQSGGQHERESKRVDKTHQAKTLSMIQRAIKIFTSYIHPVHEEAEEKFIFKPCLEAHVHVESIKTLWTQHNISQGICKRILHLIHSLIVRASLEESTHESSEEFSEEFSEGFSEGFLKDPLKDPTPRQIMKEIRELIQLLITMYEYHETVEDTVIFPDFYFYVDRKSLYRCLYNDYLDKETRSLYEHSLAEVRQLESLLHISVESVSPVRQDLKRLKVDYHDPKFE